MKLYLSISPLKSTKKHVFSHKSYQMHISFAKYFKKKLFLLEKNNVWCICDPYLASKTETNIINFLFCTVYRHLIHVFNNFFVGFGSDIRVFLDPLLSEIPVLDDLANGQVWVHIEVFLNSF